MNKKLIEYLKKHVEAGSDIAKVKQDLIKAGHDIKSVEGHINHVLKHNKIKGYIKKHIQIGSDIDKVKQALLNAGFDLSIVEEQIANALRNDKNRRHKLKITKMSMAVLLAVLVLLAGFYYLSNLFKNSEQAANDLNSEELKYQKDLENFNRALIANEADICAIIEGNTLRNECKKKFEDGLNNTQVGFSPEESADKKSFNMALINHNESMCLEIADTSLRNQCEQIL